MDAHLARKISAALIVVTVAVWVVWDVIAVAVGGAYATESIVIRDWATAHPSLALSVGIIAGHWFWNVDEVRYPQLMWAAFGVIGTALLLDFTVLTYPTVYPLWPFIGGMVLGRVLWPLENAKRV